MAVSQKKMEKKCRLKFGKSRSLKSEPEVIIEINGMQASGKQYKVPELR